MKSLNKSIPKLGKSFKRSFLGDSYRTKKEVLSAYESSFKDIEKLNEVIKHNNSEISSYKSVKFDLEDKLNRSSMHNHELKQELKLERNELDKVNRLYALSDEEVKRQSEEINDLHDKLNTFEEDYKVLEDTVNDLKSPLNVDVLKNLVDGAVDENYAKIKEKLVNFVVGTQLGIASMYGDEARKFREDLETFGFDIQHSMNPVNVDFEQYSGRVTDLSSAKFSFDEPKIYSAEHNKGFEKISFCDENSNLKLVVSNHFNPDNVFSNDLINDSVDFAKAALWGETVKFLNDEAYSSSAKIIANNGLHDMALSYLSKNKDNTALLVNMKPVLDSYK